MTELIDTVNNGETEVLVVPKGQFYGSDREGNPIPESIDETVIDDLAEKLQGKELLVDKDHSSMKQGADRDTSAMGWMYAFKKGIEGLWAKIRWTNIGRSLVENRVFRFLSPVFTLRDDKPTNMLNVALTNQPAFQDKAKPIINNKPNTEEIEMTMTREELVELIKQTIIDLKKEEKVAELDKAIENENECHDDIVDSLEQEKQAVEAGVIQNSEPAKTECHNECGDDKKTEVKNAEDTETDEVKEEIKEDKEEGKTEEEVKEDAEQVSEVKEEKEDAEQVSEEDESETESDDEDEDEEVIKLESLNSQPKTEGIDIVKNSVSTTQTTEPQFTGIKITRII